MNTQELTILYRDGAVAVCVKPAGVDSQAGLCALLTDQLGGEVYCVHRLDKAVGGVMVYARSGAAAAALSRAVDLPRGLTQYLTESCRHCPDAPCMDACCVGAITRGADGWTHVDRDACVGCRACLRACPWSLPVFDPDGKSLRCDGCMACVQICPNGALRFVEEA